MNSNNDKIKTLFNWCNLQTKDCPHVEIKNFTTSWRNGLGFCAILQNYAPNLIDVSKLNPENVQENCELAFSVAEKEFSIPALLDARDMVIMKSPDRLSIITYLFQYISILSHNNSPKKPVKNSPLASIENISNGNISKPVSEQNSNSAESSPSKSLSSPSPAAVIEESSEEVATSDKEAALSMGECPICGLVVPLLEKMTVGDKLYHRACYRQNQLANLRNRNRTLERHQVNESNRQDPEPDSSSAMNVSINASSNDSLSSFQQQQQKQQPDHKQQHLLPPLSASNRLSQGSLSSLTSIGSKKRVAPLPPPPKPPKPQKQTLPVAKPRLHKPDIEVYPDKKNPFETEEEDVQQLNPFATEEEDVQQLNPFAEFLSDEDNDNSTKGDQKKDKGVQKTTKRKAPVVPAPLKSVGTNVATTLPKEDDAELKSKEVVTETKKEKQTDPEATSEVIEVAPIDKIPEVKMRASKSEESLSTTTTSNSTHSSNRQTQKAPAPSRPVPTKREVRGDRSDFIAFETIYAQLEQVNQKQTEIETRGRTLQNALWETKEHDVNFEDMLQDWLELVQEKNELFMEEKRWHEILKMQELEERHSDLEFELRLLLGIQESLKTATEKAREEELLNQILETVNQRAMLVESEDDVHIPELKPRKKKSQNALKKLFSMKRSSSARRVLFPKSTGSSSTISTHIFSRPNKNKIQTNRSKTSSTFYHD